MGNGLRCTKRVYYFYALFPGQAALGGGAGAWGAFTGVSAAVLAGGALAFCLLARAEDQGYAGGCYQQIE